MTKLDERPYDDLLLEKGYRGFPSLAFMDAEGEVLAEPRDRTVEAFVKTRDALSRIDEVRERAGGGDAEAGVELLLLEYDLGRVTDEDFPARAAAVRAHAGEGQLARIDQINVDIEASALFDEAWRGDDAAAMEGLLALLAADRLPSANARYSGTFWSLLGQHAHDEVDTALMRRVAAGIRADFPDEEEWTARADHYDEMAAGLDERAALLARQQGGEAGLEARILVLEARYRLIELAAFRERLEAARAVAGDEEQAELTQLDVELELEHLAESFWNEGDREEIGARLLDMLAGDGPVPGEETAGLIAGPLYSWCRESEDPERIDKVVAALRARFEGESILLRLAGDLTKIAEDLRAEG